jgi:FAD/FMN-containing dehydrogenase
MAVTIVADLESGDREASVVVRIGGATADVAVARAHLKALAARDAAVLVLDVGHAESAAVSHLEAIRDFPARATGDVVARVVVLPARLPALVADASRVAVLRRGAWHVDPLRGVLTLALASDEPAMVLANLARIAETHGARVVAERWPLALAPTVEVWRPLPPALPLMRRMKAALDPLGTFASGRFVGRL